MRAITEDFLRYELRSSQPEVYVIPQGKILTPAAREYLQQRKIRIEKEGGYTYTHQLKTPVQKTEEPEEKEAQKQPEPKKTEPPERKSGDHGYRGSGNPGKCSRHSGTAETQICGL